MVIMVVKLGFMEEQINHVKSVALKLLKPKYLEEELTGVQNAKFKAPLWISRGSKDICLIGRKIYKNVLPGIELFSQGAAPQISSPLMHFTTEFEMDRSGSTSP